MRFFHNPRLKRWKNINHSSILELKPWQLRTDKYNVKQISFKASTVIQKKCYFLSPKDLFYRSTDGAVHLQMLRNETNQFVLWDTSKVWIFVYLVFLYWIYGKLFFGIFAFFFCFHFIPNIQFLSEYRAFAQHLTLNYLKNKLI